MARKKPVRVVAAVERWRAALEQIAALPSTHDGDTDEREQDDMEDAYSNGIDVGTLEGFELAAKIARAALNG
jgi:hypothetical protein